MRGITGAIACRSSCWRSGDSSEPSRAFSGATTTTSASAVSSAWRSIGGSVESSSSGASSAQIPSPGPPPVEIRGSA